MSRGTSRPKLSGDYGNKMEKHLFFIMLHGYPLPVGRTPLSPTSLIIALALENLTQSAFIRKHGARSRYDGFTTMGIPKLSYHTLWRP